MSLISSSGVGAVGGAGGGASEPHQQTQVQVDTPAVEHTHQLETYVETFLTVLIILNHRRRQKPSGQNQV